MLLQEALLPDRLYGPSTGTPQGNEPTGRIETAACQLQRRLDCPANRLFRAAAIEQSHDENGIIWPASLAPYNFSLVAIVKSDEYKTIANDLYEELKAEGFEVLYDDRKAGPGFKFKDADLLGLPLQLVLGERDHKEDGLFEIRIRKTGKKIKLKKEEIPLLARILSVADVYDALASDRAYRKKMPEERVLEIIKAGAGTQFDKRVVDIFLKLHEEGKIFEAIEDSPQQTTGNLSGNEKNG